MKNLLLLLAFHALSIVSVRAQLPDGSIAPDFTAVDINGNTHNLYDLLNAGKTVYIDFFGTYCSSCFVYHHSGALEGIWDLYGPNGTDEAFVFGIEGSAATNLACLYGPAGCIGDTEGDWVTGTPYPLLHDNGPEITDSYGITGFTTVICICSDKRMYNAYTSSTPVLWGVRNLHCVPPTIDIDIDVQHVRCKQTATGKIDITPSGGTPPLTYNWSNGFHTQDLINRQAGTYSVTIYSATGEVGLSGPIEVPEPDDPLTLNIVEITPMGCNGILASATVAGSGGWNANYDYLWQNGQTGATATNLSPGYHIVSVTDASNCKFYKTVSIAAAVYPTAAVAAPSTITCAQPSIQLNGNGSSSGPDISYQWYASNGGHIVSDSTSTTPTVNAGGNYTIVVTNDQTTCATNTTIAVIANQIQPAANAGPAQNISCTLPQATLQGTGSTGANFSYLWTPTDGGNIVSGATTLNPVVNARGTYTLKVTNSNNGCTQSSATTVGGTVPPTLATTSGVLNCLAPAITLTTTTNAASPTFAWTGPNNFMSSQKSPNVSVSGSYNVVVTDSITTCTSTATANITANTTAPGASTKGDTLTCIIHSVTITASTPDTSARFAWTGPNGFFSTLQSLTLADSGTYHLVVTDTLNGCTSTGTAAVVLDDVAPTASAVTPGNLNCNTAQLQLNGAGSSQGAAYSYLWTATNGGHIVSGDSTQTPLVDAVGTYSILVSNADNGCISTASANVLLSPTIAAAIAAQTNVACNGGSSGSATVNGLGGNNHYNYAWSNGASTASISGLSVGTYVVVVTDGENCSASSSVTIIQPDEVIKVNASSTAQSAFGQQDGTATASPTGGVAGYAYAWDNGGDTQTISGLAPGNYTVLVNDANGCTAAQTVTVNAFNCTLAANVSATNLTCFGANNGAAQVSVTTGASPMTFAWSNGATTQSVSNLPAGLLTLNITDGDGCPAAFSVNISEPNAIAANATSTPESALGANNGSATANPTGGTGAYIYKWNTGSTTQTITDLVPGAYAVVVTDANGCTTQQEVEVSSFLCVISSVNTITNVSCAGASNGAVTISLTGGTAPFNYTWSNGGTSATISNLTGGGYQVNISDANGCSFSTSATVAEPAPYSAWDLAIQNPLCPSDATGAATASILGGTLPYTFLWSNGVAGNTIANVPQGNYSVQVTDANGCQSGTSVTLTSSDSEPPSITAQNATIALDANGTAQLSLAALGAQFSDNCGIASTSISQQIFDCTQLGQHIVTVTATDLSGISASTTATVNVVDNIVPVLTCPASIVVCSYDNVVDYASAVAQDNCLLAGNGHWDLLSGLPSGSTFLEGATTQIYNYTDASGNTGACSFSVTVTSAVVFTNIVVNNDLNGQHTGSIDITVSGGDGPYAYEWQDENGNPIATTEDLTGVDQGLYSVQVIDANGCLYTQNDLKVSNTVGSKEPTWLTGVSLQPNPTSGLTRIVFAQPVATALEISVIDATGRVLLYDVSEQKSEVTINCSNLPGGVYTLRFRTGQEIGVRKLVVSR
ncbi:MAG: T9SS type A sorting domain-containing protein [Phycisphaerae bacterium]|nr:T9SS type A sorting domain-containing protein [Saprospiraceae bacterium]